MVETQPEGPWRHQGRAYAVLTADGVTGRPEWMGLSHSEAMTLAEKLRRDGNVARVMHVVGDRSYEVDRYPAR
jgi:hypothetical protein